MQALDARRKTGRPSNASIQRGDSSNAASGSRPRKAPRNGRAGTTNKRSGTGARSSAQDGDGKRGTKRKQTTLRDSLGASARRGATSDQDEEDEHASTRARKRGGRPSDASRRSSQGAGASSSSRVIGRRGVPQPNQPASTSLGQDSRRTNNRGNAEEGGSDSDDHDDEQRSDDAPSESPPSPPKPYVHVAPHTRRVRQSAIEAKWSPLAEASLAAVSTTLQSAQRPILQRLSDSPLRRTHTASALRLISHRIARKMSRGLPFPMASMPANVGRAPLQSDGGREVELNFESVLDGKLALERQLEPALDGLEVLQEEKESMEEELERDYETLRNLEAGARAQAREQRSLLKKAHVLTPAPPPTEEDGKADTADEQQLGFSRHDAAFSGGAFTHIDENDDALHPLSVQLGDHVDSIRDNLQQTDGILPQLARGQAGLKAVLLKYLDLRQYEQVVLG